MKFAIATTIAIVAAVAAATPVPRARRAAACGRDTDCVAGVEYCVDATATCARIPGCSDASACTRDFFDSATEKCVHVDSACPTRDEPCEPFVYGCSASCVSTATSYAICDSGACTAGLPYLGIPGMRCEFVALPYAGTCRVVRTDLACKNAADCPNLYPDLAKSCGGKPRSCAYQANEMQIWDCGLTYKSASTGRTVTFHASDALYKQNGGSLPFCAETECWRNGATDFGVCTTAPRSCDDANDCTNDCCDEVANVCTHDWIFGCAHYCSADYDCPDDVNCIDFYCDQVTGMCAYTNNTANCA